jgi:hypothetical protein
MRQDASGTWQPDNQFHQVLKDSMTTFFDSIALVHHQTPVGAIVSRERYNMLEDNFEFTGNVRMIHGGYPGERGMAFAFHCDPRGAEALGGPGAANGIHGGAGKTPSRVDI